MVQSAVLKSVSLELRVQQSERNSGCRIQGLSVRAQEIRLTGVPRS